MKIKIDKIEVVRLFGYYNYVIEKGELSSNNKLFLLYGDNGSGKTTILKTLFYLLSSQDGAGHKTELAKTKFQKFIVAFNNGVSIRAIRKNKNLLGSYDYQIFDKKKKIFDFPFKTDPNDYSQVIRTEDKKEEEHYQRILKYISNLNIKLFFLADTRKTMNAGVANLIERENQKSLEYSNEIYLQREGSIRRRKKDQHDPTELTISALENWIRSKALVASKFGDRQTNTIYLEIVDQITNTEFTGGRDISSKIAEFKELLNEVNDRTANHEKFGLISKTEYSQITGSLEAVSDSKKEIIYNVIEPFIRGIKAKLDAQEKLQILLSTFINELNDYFTNKEISYSLATGFRIKLKRTENKIDFRNLSSGEKQLILLFTNTILASSQATIFIIDEPEISLNVKWQRKLLNTLLSFSPDEGVQFFIATHSIELLTSRKDDVMKLENID